MSPEETRAIEKRARRAAKATGRPYTDLLSELTEKHLAECEEAEREDADRMARLHLRCRAGMGATVRLLGAIGALTAMTSPLHWRR